MDRNKATEDSFELSKWQKYQKGKYFQVTMKFSKESLDDLMLYHFIKKYESPQNMIKTLVREKMWKEAYRDE